MVSFREKERTKKYVVTVLFFDPSTSSMRKGCDGDKIEKWNVEKTVKIADHYRCCQATT